MKQDPIVIVSAARTPMGGFQGELKGFAAPELGASAIRAAVERAKVKPEEVQEVIMGCVLPAGQGQAPARQASLGAGLPLAAGCTTLNKMCGSGMKAAMLAHDLLSAGSMDVVVAGGMESMSNAPYLLPKARAGYRMGHAQVLDHMFYDGLEDAYDKGRLMGSFAEDCAQKYGFTREAQDAFAIASLSARSRRTPKAGSPGRPPRLRSRLARTKNSSRWTSSHSRRISTRSRRCGPRSARTARSRRRIHLPFRTAPQRWS
jgi:acetyl-CoA C-acetyltransferase